MSIIRFMAKSMILRAAQPQQVVKNRRTNKRHTMMFSSPSEFKTSFRPMSPGTKERQNFRATEMAPHIFNDLNMEIGILEKQHKMMSQQNENTFEIINKGREKLSEIQSSKSNNMLSDVVNMLLKRGESISTFLDQIQSNVNLQTKDIVQVENFSKLKDHYEQEAILRVDLAKSKLNQLFQQHLATSEQKKKQMMTSFECQVKIDQKEGHQQKIKINLNSKKSGFNDQIKTLKAKNKSLLEQNSALKIFITQKTEQFQKTIADMAAQKLQMHKKIVSESKINLQIFNIGKRQNNVDNADNISQIYSNKSCQSLNNEKKQTTLFIKRLKVNKPMKQKIQLHLSNKNLSICKLVVNQLVNYSRQQIVNHGQRFVYKSMQSIQPINIQQIIQNKNNNISSKIKYEGQQNYLQKQKTCQDEDKLVKVEVELKQDEFDEKRNKNFNEQNLNNKISLKKNIKNYLKNRKQFTEQTEARDSQHIVEGKKKQSIVHIYLPLQISYNSKVLTEPNEEQIYVKTSNKLSKLKPQQRQRFPIEKQANITISQISNQNIKYKMINCSGETGKYKLKQQLVIFQEEDLINLFLNEGNAYNYELLNVSLVTKANYYTTAMNGKNTILKNVKNIADNSNKDCIVDRQQQQQSNMDVDEVLINIVYKYLKTMKFSKQQRDSNNYHALKNFIRFPFSSINRRDEATWKEHERQNHNLQYCQLKKYIKRIIKLHQCCKIKYLENKNGNRQSQSQANSLQNFVCQHWKVFFMKLGINLFDDPKQY